MPFRRAFANGLNGTILSCGLVAPVEREEILGFGWRLGIGMGRCWGRSEVWGERLGWDDVGVEFG